LPGQFKSVRGGQFVRYLQLEIFCSKILHRVKIKYFSYVCDSYINLKKRNLMKNIFFLCLFFLIILATDIYAQHTGTLSDMEFIAGHWETTRNGKMVKAFWTESEGDNMVGVVRVIGDGKAVLYEMFAIEMTDTGLEIKVKHFKPGLIGVEEKDKFDHYKFLESSNGRAVFEKQGEEVRILYEVRPENKFVVAVGTSVNGEWEYEDFWLFSLMN